MTSAIDMAPADPPRRPAATARLAAPALALALGLGLALLMPATPAQADAVVLTSSAPNLDPGDSLDDAAVIEVPAGASVTLITRRGKTVTLAGPYTGPADQAGATGQPGRSDETAEDAASVIRRLLVRSPDDLSSLGAGRAVGDTVAGTLPAEPDAGPRDIDVDRDGVHCVDPADPPGFRRLDGALARSVPIVGADANTRIDFASDQTSAPWPPALALDDGLVYRVPDDADDPSGPASLILRVVDRAGREEVDWILALARAGCGAQAARALAAYRERTVALSVYVTSDRGPAPIYRVGESVHLAIRANRNAYLYCYAVPSSGPIIPLFPVDGSRGAGVAANATLSVPGDRWPGHLAVVSPPGEDAVRCYGTDRDVTDRLPDTVVPLSHTPLPADVAASLDDLFRDLAANDGVALAVAELRLTVTE